MGPVVLLAVTPHADLYFFFLVPAVAHGALISTPCLHGLGTLAYQGRRENINCIAITDWQNMLYIDKNCHIVPVTQDYSLF